MLLGQNLAAFGPITASHIPSSISVAEGFALGRPVGVSVTTVTRDADKTERSVTVDMNRYNQLIGYTLRKVISFWPHAG
jgi:hypothetical protein